MAGRRPTPIRTASTTELRNRIIRQEMLDPRSLMAHEHNWRTHSDAQREAMRAMLQRVGFVAPVMVNERTGRLVDGHLRVEIAVEENMAELPVDIVDLTEEEEATVLAAYDPLGTLAGIDPGDQLYVLGLVRSQEDELQRFLDTLEAEAQATVDLFAGDGGAFDEGDPADDDFETGEMAAAKAEAKNIWVVVSGSSLGVVERAMRATGEQTREKALLKLAQSFLNIAEDAAELVEE